MSPVIALDGRPYNMAAMQRNVFRMLIRTKSATGRKWVTRSSAGG